MNLDFEGGWTRKTHNGQEYGEIFTPVGWTSFWREEVANYLFRPEMQVIEKVPPFLDPPRVQNGQKALKHFKLYGRIDCGVYQVITGLRGKLTISAWAHAWYSMRDNPHQSEYEDGGQWLPINDGDPGIDLRVGIGPPTPDPWSNDIQWRTANVYDEYKRIILNTYVDDDFCLYLRAEALYPFKHTDVYWDYVTIDVDKPEGCRGLPREQYRRTYYLLPQNATKAQTQATVDLAYPDRSTVGFSADDAGIGDLDHRIVKVVWPTDSAWNGTAIEAFFQEHYPGVAVEHVSIGGQPPGQPAPESGNGIGLHILQNTDNSAQYCREGKPRVVKVFSGGDAQHYKQAYPDCKVIFRKYIQNDGWDFVKAPDQRRAANQHIDAYAPDLDRFGQYIDYVEAANETISHNYEQNLESVRYDRIFAEELHKRYPQIGPCLLNIAVGNPHESQFKDLVPAVERIVEYAGVVGYHAYWTANRDRNWLEDKWKYHAGRWTEMDKVFNQHGLYPNYAATEGGIVFSNTGDDMHSGLGWKAAGSIEDYLDQMDIYNALVTQWNAEHNHRCLGVTLFSVGGWGWEEFWLGSGEIEL
ncbi:hypothetical protein GF380_00365, partial [Candidatus Uhrbacteria bacterium]|nr:hypothetical protein [Candidatus Uhrbacteria bacterium]